MATYVVTGGAGFIGSNLVEALLERGDTVRVIDNLSTGRPVNLEPFLGRIEFHELDIFRDADELPRVFEGADFVLHQAALPSVVRSVESPLESNDSNVTGTLRVLLAARDAGVRRLVYASSSSAYGDTEVLPKREDMPTCPMSPYAVAKLAGEHYCRVFTGVYGLETVSLRYFNVFGPRQDPASLYAAVIPIFTRLMLEGRRPTIYGDGEQSRDFTYIGNVVQANLLACTAPGAAGLAFNIGAGGRTSLLQLVGALNELLGTRIVPVHEPPRAGDVRHSEADISLARRVLGYQPAISFKEGLRMTVDWYRRSRS